MKLTVRLFAVLRERTGRSLIELEFEEATVTEHRLKEVVANTWPEVAPFLSVVRVAVNEVFLEDGQAIKDGDDVVLIPPVSGGSGRGSVAAPLSSPLFRIQDDAIDPSEVFRAIEREDAGAVVTFTGTVRSATAGRPVLALEYEAYDAMAIRAFRLIEQEIESAWPSTRLSIVHRVGRLVVGEIAVVIAVSSPHRDAAFSACRHAIERIKVLAPIWKKEIGPDGVSWVGLGS